MTRTVSTRISNSRHEVLRDRCNFVGCSISEYLAAALDMAIDGSVNFNFGNEDEGEEESEASEKAEDPPRVYHVKL